jgi:hypothetical protein
MLFFDWKKSRWQVWAIKETSLSNPVAEPPREIGPSQVFSWHWLDNERLIGQHHALMDPPIPGYSEEGWTDSTALFVFDVNTGTINSVAWPSPLTTTEKEFQIDPLRDGNTLVVPMKRYYSIHSASEKGHLHLVSCDTTQPEGGNQRDEGWYILKHR